MRKKFTIFLVLFVWLLLFALSADKASAATYSYTLSNLQSTSCAVGSEYTPMNLTSSGDIVQIFGYNFGNRSVDDYILEMIYLQINTNKWEVYRGMRSDADGSNVYFGPISWTDNQINFEVKPGFGNSIGSDLILRIHSSSDDNHGSCVRGVLTPGLICTSFTYSNWTACQSNETQSRTVINYSPEGCTGGNPILTQSCSLPTPKITSIFPTTVRRGDTLEVIGENFDSAQNITQMEFKPSFSLGEVISWLNTKILVKVSSGASTGANTVSFVYKNQYISSPEFTVKDTCKLGDDWTCSDYGTCTESGVQTRNCIKSGECEFLNSPTPSTTKNCTYIPPIPFCTSNNWSCASWSTCSSSGSQTRTCNKTSNCQGEASSPATSQSCTYTPACTEFLYSLWSECGSDGKQTRKVVYKKPANCEGGEIPELTRSCSYTPSCERDLWECDSWGECSPNGAQTRSCNKTFDCPSTETAVPATSKFCEASVRSNNNNTEENINREQIFKSTVKLICMIDQKWAKLGSGTIIDQYGTILTNRHVVDGTLGACEVDFITNEDDIPFFGGIADVKRISTDPSLNGDMSILKIRNTGNKIFTAINILQSNSDNLKSGDYILPFGYPLEEDFGATITFTEGPYSGRGTTITISNKAYDVKGFFKTTATIDHGNSGGGAYQKRTGLFMGMPTLGVNKINYILSVNQIKKWLNSLGGYDVTKNNFSALKNYYSQSADINNIDLSVIKILDSSDNTNLIDKDNSNKLNPSTNQAQVDTKLSSKLKGKILLQVESHGEAWYINPKTGSKHYMANGNEAYRIMRYLGVGITNKDLEKIKANKIFAKKNSGKIFLQVEAKGEAYYIDFNGNSHYLKDGSAAYSIMRDLGLGIKNADLSKIAEGSL